MPHPSLLLLLATACRLDPSGRNPGRPPVEPTDDPGGSPCAASLVISEVQSTNVATLADDQGDTVDWVEIANPTGDPVDLDRWHLTDDRDDPEMWAFPEATLAAGGFVVVHASGKGTPTRTTWDTRIDAGDPWRYLPVVVPPSPGWRNPGYDDGGWETGPSGFGRRASGGVATVVDADVVYARTTFTASAEELADLARLFLHVASDDGFVAYLNGVEVARSNLGLSGIAPWWDDTATVDLPPGAGQPPIFDLTDVAWRLVPGENTLAVEAHAFASSADLALTPYLTLGFRTTGDGRASSVLDWAARDLTTNFQLRASGERVTLFDPDGCEADSVEPGPMLGDQSYGRTADGGLAYFLEPTPGAANDTEARPGFAATPTFDPPPGLHPGGARVSVTSEGGAVVHVAWEGREPLESDPVAEGPLATGTDGEAVVLRARAWQDGLWPSRIATATYVLLDSPDLPVVSLTTDPANLWDDELGIYTFGSEYDPVAPFYGANFWDERVVPAHLEAWESDGTPMFSVDAGVSIHGGYSRAHEQKALLVELDGAYGDAEIPSAIFPDVAVDAYDRVLLRAAGNDWIGCGRDGCGTGAQLRDALMARIAASSGVDTMAYRPARLYLDGEYWGLYDLRERPDTSYVRDHAGEEDIDLLEYGGEVVHGDAVHYQATLDFLRTHDLSIPANYAEAAARIDLEEYADWQAFEIFYANGDWPGNNLKFWRPRTPDGRWRWMLYDTDFGLGPYGGTPDVDSLGLALAPDGPSWPNPPWSTELFRLLMTSRQFEQLFVARYADRMNTDLAYGATRAVLEDLEEGIEEEIPRQYDRWGSWTDGVTSHAIRDDGDWVRELEGMEDWLHDRPAFAREHLVTHLGLAGTYTLALDTDPPGAGTFHLAAADVPGPFSGTYFLGVPVRVTAVPAPGWTFVGWSDPDQGDGATVTLDPAADLELVARFE